MIDYGVSVGADFVARIDSRNVADALDKEHSAILQRIKEVEILSKDSLYRDNFLKKNDEKAGADGSPFYLMTRLGFAMVSSCYDGDYERDVRRDIVEGFTQAETWIKKYFAALDMGKTLTRAIKESRVEDKAEDYIREADMIYRIVLNQSPTDYRKLNDICPVKPIDKYIDEDAKALLDWIKCVDVGIQFSTPEYQLRKQLLELCAYRWRNKKTNDTADDEDEEEEY